MTLYTTVSLGGYGEALLLGTLMLIWALQLYRTPGGQWSFFGWGVLAGVAFWAFGITLVYSLPSGVLLLAALRRHHRGKEGLTRVALLLVGGLLGAAPWIAEAVRLGPAVFVAELLGSAIAGVEGLNWLNSIYAHLTNLLLFGTTAAAGLRPPWEVRWLAWPLLPFAAGAWLVMAHALTSPRRCDREGTKLLLLGWALACAWAFY
jgi:hypothetical protein